MTWKCRAISTESLFTWPGLPRTINYNPLGYGVVAFPKLTITDFWHTQRSLLHTSDFFLLSLEALVRKLLPLLRPRCYFKFPRSLPEVFSSILQTVASHPHPVRQLHVIFETADASIGGLTIELMSNAAGWTSFLAHYQDLPIKPASNGRKKQVKPHWFGLFKVRNLRVVITRSS